MQKLEPIKYPTGIEGLDLILNGGLKKGRGLLIIGGPGSGKTIMLSQFLNEGITKFHENGVFVTFEEKPKYITENVKSFGWEFGKFVDQNKLFFVDLSPNVYNEEVSIFYDLDPILERIKYAVNKINAQRVVIDGLANLFQKFSNKRMIREVVYKISDQLKTLGICYLASTEKLNMNDDYNVEEYIFDGIMELGRDLHQEKFERTVEIKKLRGASYLEGKSVFEISNSGILIYPEIKLDGMNYAPLIRTKAKFGIPTLDKALAGGLPRGSVTLLAGQTGTGKTTLSASFLYEGLRQDEKALCISFKDPSQDIDRLTSHLGMHLDRYVKQNKLKFITRVENPDKLFHHITEIAEKIDAKRVMIDSISFIDPTYAYPEKVTQFYIRLMRWFKIKGITCLVNYLTPEQSLSNNSDVTLAAETPIKRVFNGLADGIILLRFHEDGHRIRRELNIIKLRGSNHSTDIFEYINDNEGFRLLPLPQKLDIVKEL